MMINFKPIKLYILYPTYNSYTIFSPLDKTINNISLPCIYCTPPGIYDPASYNIIPPISPPYCTVPPVCDPVYYYNLI